MKSFGTLIGLAQYDSLYDGYSKEFKLCIGGETYIGVGTQVVSLDDNLSRGMNRLRWFEH